jgi:hypothetical protein
VKIKDDWFEIGKKRKGRSSLTKYSCGCQNAWIGAAEFAARCERCGNEFVKATALRQALKEIAELDFIAEAEWRLEPEWLEPRETNEWEDLSTYTEQ